MPKSVADLQSSKRKPEDAACDWFYAPITQAERRELFGDDYDRPLTRDEQTEELVDRADWLLDKEKEGE